MAKNSLNIIAVESNQNAPKKPQSRIARREEIQSKYEKLWESDPLRFNPDRNVMERERIERTWRLMQEILPPSSQAGVDLGCGFAPLTLRLKGMCEKIHAVDAAAKPLRLLDEKKFSFIETSQDCMPHTKLNDDYYDIVIATDLIALLPKEDFRLFMAELARLVKLKGYVICSTPIDINSEDALQVFVELFETEFKLEKWSLSYHAYYLRLCNLFNAPCKFLKANNNADYRKKELAKRSSLGQWWFRLNSSALPCVFWFLVRFLTRPIYKYLKQSKFWLINLEKICKTLSPEAGVSHAIFIGQRRPLFEDLPQNKQPVTRKGKREVWE